MKPFKEECDPLSLLKEPCKGADFSVLTVMCACVHITENHRKLESVAGLKVDYIFHCCVLKITVTLFLEKTLKNPRVLYFSLNFSLFKVLVEMEIKGLKH